MSNHGPSDELRFVVVGYIGDDEQLVTLRVSADAVPVARARGWMVWDDVVRGAETVAAPQGDGDAGHAG
jgi:hypothetical protein